MDNNQEVKPIEQKEATPPIQTQAAADAEETPQQIDWRKFKEARKIERQQRESAEKRAHEKEQEAAALKSAMEALLTKQAVPQNASASPEDLTEDQRIQMKIDQAINERDKRLSEQRAIQEQKESLSKAAQAFPDFTKVYTTENCDYLEYHHPELFESLKNEPDSFQKWSRVYNALKRYIPNTDTKKDIAKAERNMSKPQSSSISGKTETSDASVHMPLDDKRKSENWRRMQRALKGL